VRRHGCGPAYCWGWNLYGQLGDGTTINRLTPVRVVRAARVMHLLKGKGGFMQAFRVVLVFAGLVAVPPVSRRRKPFASATACPSAERLK